MIYVTDERRLRVERQKNLGLKDETFCFGFDAGPNVGFRRFARTVCFAAGVKLAMIGVMGDGAGIPDNRMAPRRFADEKSGFLGPGFHAAATRLTDD